MLHHDPNSARNRYATGVSLLVLLLLGTAGWADAQDRRDAVVKITSKSPGGERRTGTGFVVKVDANAAFILTAAHVVRGDKQPAIEFRARPADPVDGVVLNVDEPLDVALLVVRGAGSLQQGLRALNMAPNESLEVGQDVVTIGFPPGLSWAVTKPTIASEEGSRLALSGGSIDEGSSGGPVLKGDAVVAMVIAAERGSGRAVPVQYLAGLLKSWRIDVATSVPPAPPRQQAAQPELPTGPTSPPAAQQQATKPQPAQALSPGQTFRDCDDCPEMVVVPAGRFTMGSPPTEAGRVEDEGPTHAVGIARPFAVGRYEVTRGELRRFVDKTKHDMSRSCWQDLKVTPSDQHPVVCVSWDDAKAYANWLAKKTGKPYRLLSETEWEYAARAGTTTSRFWGDDEQAACRFANVSWCGAKGSAQVGKFEPNAYGLYDTLGSVWEWVEDCYHYSYGGAPTDGLAWVSGTCGGRVVRGGGWNVGPHDVRSAIRFMFAPDYRVNSLGFRVARTLP